MSSQSGELSDIHYDALVLGERRGPYIEHVSAGLAARLSADIGDVKPVSVAPPAVFPVMFLRALRHAMGGIPAGSVLARQELTFGEPVPVNTSLHITTWISERYVRRGRPYVVIEFDVRRADGETAATGRKVIVWPTGPAEEG
jgi:hypothetical protein